MSDSHPIEDVDNNRLEREYKARLLEQNCRNVVKATAFEDSEHIGLTVERTVLGLEVNGPTFGPGLMEYWEDLGFTLEQLSADFEDEAYDIRLEQNAYDLEASATDEEDIETWQDEAREKLTNEEK